ncbi:MAG: class I SAM-dependent methyltransferase [Tumebacillaceae bacterium]
MENKKEDIKGLAREQFGKTAEAYAVSRIHAYGEDLPRLIEIAQPNGTEKLLDVATGAGHTLVTFAPHIAHGLGFDLTPEMLEQAKKLADDQGISNVSFVQGDAENLPFADGEFEIVTARICAHHFPNLERAMAEMARVLKPGGVLLIIDNYAPEEDEADQFINRIEKWRDPSHVREWKLSEWQKFFADAGLLSEVAFTYRTHMAVSSWTKRSQTPADVVERIVQEIAATSQAVRDVQGIREVEGDWEFDLLKAVIVGRK